MLENDSITRFKNACINFDVNSTAKVSVLATTLDDLAVDLAKHPELRCASSRSRVHPVRLTFDW